MRQSEARLHGALQTTCGKDLRFYSRDEERFLEGSDIRGSLWKDAQGGGRRSGRSVNSLLQQSRQSFMSTDNL